MLELDAIREILKAPKKRERITRALALQARIRFHTETNVARFQVPQAQIFLDWVSHMLPKDKFATFLSLFQFPLPSSTVVEDVYRELERVFDSRNFSVSFQFKDQAAAEDWAAYRTVRLHEPQIWRTCGWHKMQVSPNSILIVDMPPVQTTERPEPYFYWLDLESVIDYKLVEGDWNRFEWLIFKQGCKKIAVFDELSIRIFEINDKNEIVRLESQAFHGLTYCPARFFWSTPLNEKERDIKKNPLTKELANLDWYLFFALSKRHLDLYAPYPIYSAYQEDCNYENSETGDYCDGGFLRNSKGNYKFAADGSIERCPICGSKHLAGPGSFIEVPVPNQSEGVADMRNPVQITTIDRESLDYNVKEVVRLKDEIITSIVGSGGTVSEKEAINETQVSANFESKTSVLNALKTNFELAQKFVDDTICKLRYAEAFIDSSINWGTEFYIFTVGELYKRYKEAKESGASDAELNALAEQILEVEYRNNPIELQRMRVLRQLEPYPNKTTNEVVDLFDKGLLDEDQVRLKVNFTPYIKRFERENIDIVSFASGRPMREKVSTILQTLQSYVSEEKRKGAQEPQA